MVLPVFQASKHMSLGFWIGFPSEIHRLVSCHSCIKQMTQPKAFFARTIELQRLDGWSVKKKISFQTSYKLNNCQRFIGSGFLNYYQCFAHFLEPPISRPVRERKKFPSKVQDKSSMLDFILDAKIFCGCSWPIDHQESHCCWRLPESMRDWSGTRETHNFLMITSQ